MYWKTQIGAMAFPLCVASTLFLAFLQNSLIHQATAQPSSLDQRRELYHDADKDRVAVQQQTGKYVSMDGAYNGCLTPSSTDESCSVALTQLRERLNELRSFASTPTPAQEPTAPFNMQDNDAVVIQDNRLPFWPTEAVPPYQPPAPTPRNYYTPKPGFVPGNKYQAGDGF